ncbi:hypothetical protein ACP70R_024774 [Stipagrostis hirtigluma subsp. patula]
MLVQQPEQQAPPLPPTALQRLVDACRAELDGSDAPPAAAAVSVVRGMIDKIGPDDVGLMDDARFSDEMNGAAAGDRQSPPIITCKTVYQCDNFTMAVFFLPPGAAMPLHDHPGLTVFSKLLVGSARVVSYDWAHPRRRRACAAAAAGSSEAPPGMMLAEKVLDGDFTAASGAWVLFPDAGGNMHRFRAGEDGPCAFLDVLTPPYSPARQGACAFYQDIPYHLHDDPDAVSGGELTEEQKRRLAWLQKIDEPKDLRISNLPYKGPPIF